MEILPIHQNYTMALKNILLACFSVFSIQQKYKTRID